VDAYASRDNGGAFLADLRRERLENVLRVASFAMIILDEERRIELANDRARALLLSATVGPVEGLALAAALASELRGPFEAIVSVVLRERRMVEADRVPAPDDRVLDVVGYAVEDGAAANLPDDGARMTGGKRRVVIVAHDVTERLVLEGQLVQSSKLATIGELAAGVAHEINNPTAFVQSNLKTIERYWGRLRSYVGDLEAFVAKVAAESQGPLAEAAQHVAALRASLKIAAIEGDLPDALSESVDGTVRIQKIVQDLKSFARPDDEQFRAVSLVEVAERALRLVSNELKYVANVEQELAPVPRVFGNASQLSQVVVNLLMNAVQAIEREGRITVRTRLAGRDVVLEVADDGSGIPRHVLPRIFDPFFTTKPPGRGTGLGLPVSLGIVERHGGHLQVESEEGKGALFRVVLQAVEAWDDAADGTRDGAEGLP
jgi:signal transduction histidine kinase